MSFYRDFNDKVAIEAWNGARRKPYETIEVAQLSPTIGAEIRGGQWLVERAVQPDRLRGHGHRDR